MPKPNGRGESDANLIVGLALMRESYTGAQPAARGTPTYLHTSHRIVGVVSLGSEKSVLENDVSIDKDEPALPCSLNIIA
jgi:hypothetical protein